MNSLVKGLAFNEFNNQLLKELFNQLQSTLYFPERFTFQILLHEICLSVRLSIVNDEQVAF